MRLVYCGNCGLQYDDDIKSDQEHTTASDGKCSNCCSKNKIIPIYDAQFVGKEKRE